MSTRVRSSMSFNIILQLLFRKFFIALSLYWYWLDKDKDKDKEALFNVAYNVTDNISSWAILRHNNYIFNRYLPVFISLAQTPFMRASARELLVPFFTPLVWCGRGIRTHDLPLRKRTLYQLSYRGGYLND